MQFRQMQSDAFPLVGGLDLVTVPAAVKPGRVSSCVNFEPDNNGGYTKMKGIERFDGRPSPSDASYYIAPVSITGTVIFRDVITGSVSGATGVVISVEGTNRLVLAKVDGEFVEETFTIGGTPQGTITEALIDSETDVRLHAVYKNLAADVYRDDIAEVPGSGPVRGVKYYKGEKYALRDNEAATACVLHKATPTGWQEVPFGRELQFDNATAIINDGDVVVGATSLATGIVKRALLRTGTWASQGVGTLVFDSVSGTFQDGENIMVGGVNKVVADGADTAVSLLPGGKFEFEIINFFGTAGTERLYAADGVNLLGEFDGTTWVPIRTGLTVDNPKFVREHRKHLIVSVLGSVFTSGTGDPYSYTAITGAAEIGTGSLITGLSPEVGDGNSGAMLVLTDQKCFMMYGNDASDFNLVLHSPQSGGKAYTVQNLGYSHFLNNRGVTQLVSSQSFGNFQLNVLTKDIQPLLDQKRGMEIASCVVRNNNQYWIFFNDGSGIIMQVLQSNNANAPTVGPSMTFDYGSDRVMNVIDSFVDVDSIDRVLAGSNDGFVYELNKGTTLDGDSMRFYIMLHFNHSRSLRIRKNYRRTVFHVEAQGYAEFKVGHDLGFGKRSIRQSRLQSEFLVGKGGFWDSFVWTEFVWDTPIVEEINVYTPGNGDSIALIVAGDSEITEQFTLQTCIPYFKINRPER